MTRASELVHTIAFQIALETARRSRYLVALSRDIYTVVCMTGRHAIMILPPYDGNRICTPETSSAHDW